MSQAKRMVSLDRFRRLAGQSQNKGAVNRDAQFPGSSCVNSRAISSRVPFLMLFRICWLPDSYPTSSSRRPLSRMISSVFRGTLALALHDQVMPSLPRRARNLLGARQIVGEGVVVEEKLPHLREIFLRRGHFRFHAVRAAHPVAVPAQRLRPQAERALRAAAPARVERDVRMLQVADEVVLDGQIALVHVHHDTAARPCSRSSAAAR